MKPIRNMIDPESRAFWEKLEQRSEEFKRWAPDWLKKGLMDKFDIHGKKWVEQYHPCVICFNDAPIHSRYCGHCSNRVERRLLRRALWKRGIIKSTRRIEKDK